MNLIVVESPTKARTLSRFLGSEYSVEATMGHIKDLPKSKLSVDIEHNFKPEYVDVVKRKDVIKKILDEAKKAKSIYIATDPDREGEAIAKHVEEVLFSTEKLKNKKTKKDIRRIVFHEITKHAVEDAIANPRDIDANLVDAQVARRVLDRLVGYKLSPILWKKIRLGLSAGRVQSVAVRLIVEREREIGSFKPEEYWEIYCDVKTKRLKNEKTTEDTEKFTVKLIKIDGKSAKVDNGDTAKKIVTDLRTSDFKVAEIVKKEVKKHPYPPLTTSTMTQAGARLLGWSAKKTMSVAQALYEEGLITYHRTDSTNLSVDAINMVRDFIKGNYGNDYLPEKPKFYKTSAKVAQEAHEAIRPTDVNSKFEIRNSKYEREGETLYGIIWKRFVACQMNPSLYDETKIDVTASLKQGEGDSSDGGKIVYLLRTTGQIMKFDGWRKVLQGKVTDDAVVILPQVEKDEALDLMKVTSDQKFTQPPARYTEATLIKTLESLGIGRPSTYAPTITTIQVRQYVEKDEGKFKPTSIGIAVNDYLVKYFGGEVEYSFTAKMEGQLDDIANGNAVWTDIIREFWTPFEGKLKDAEEKSERVKIEAEKLGKKCPQCIKDGLLIDKQGDLVIRIGRFGKFISCSRFPECKFTDKYQERINMKCPDCKVGQVIIKRTKRGKKFFGCSKYPNCKWASWRKPS